MTTMAALLFGIVAGGVLALLLGMLCASLESRASIRAARRQSDSVTTPGRSNVA